MTPGLSGLQSTPMISPTDMNAGSVCEQYLYDRVVTASTSGLESVPVNGHFVLSIYMSTMSEQYPYYARMTSGTSSLQSTTETTSFVVRLSASSKKQLRDFFVTSSTGRL